MTGNSGPTGAVVALKVLTTAKSRLGVPDAVRHQLARVMFCDTVRALAEAVDAVVVVSAEPGLQELLGRLGIAATVRPEPVEAGLNPALRSGAEYLRDVGMHTVIAAVGDLPALSAPAVAATLAAAGRRGAPRVFVPDHSGTGTTMVIASEATLNPCFEGESATAHEHSGAVRITDEELAGFAPLLRSDVDTAADLTSVRALGLGWYTAAMIDPGSGRLGQPDLITVAEPVDDQPGSYAVINSSGYRHRLDLKQVFDRPRHLRPGQRLMTVTANGRPLTAWW